MHFIEQQEIEVEDVGQQSQRTINNRLLTIREQSKWILQNNSLRLDFYVQNYITEIRILQYFNAFLYRYLEITKILSCLPTFQDLFNYCDLVYELRLIHTPLYYSK